MRTECNSFKNGFVHCWEELCAGALFRWKLFYIYLIFLKQKIQKSGFNLWSFRIEKIISHSLERKKTWWCTWLPWRSFSCCPLRWGSGSCRGAASSHPATANKILSSYCSSWGQLHLVLPLQTRSCHLTVAVGEQLHLILPKQTRCCHLTAVSGGKLYFILPLETRYCHLTAAVGG